LVHPFHKNNHFLTSLLLLPHSKKRYEMIKIKKKWKCIICGAKGKKWQTSWKANRSGRQHINNKHNGNGKLQIM
jgi:hypothetical protein